MNVPLIIKTVSAAIIVVHVVVTVQARRKKTPLFPKQ